jgi:hypothetical protein
MTQSVLQFTFFFQNDIYLYWNTTLSLFCPDDFKVTACVFSRPVLATYPASWKFAFKFWTVFELVQRSRIVLHDPRLKSPQGQDIFILCETFRSVLGPTKLPVQRVPGFLPGSNGRTVMLTIHLYNEWQSFWSYTTVFPVCLHGVERHHFTSSLLIQW